MPVDAAQPRAARDLAPGLIAVLAGILLWFAAEVQRSAAPCPSTGAPLSTHP